MEQVNNHPQSGSYRIRAACVAGYQFGVAVVYSFVALYQLGLIWTEFSNWANVAVPEHLKNGTFTVFEFIFPFEAFNLYVVALFCWMILNAIGGLVQFYSSVLIWRATGENVDEEQAIRFCNFAGMVNISILTYECITFLITMIFQPSASLIEIAIYVVPYRIWFNHDMLRFRNELLY